jgi:hypothetical protein
MTAKTFLNTIEINAQKDKIMLEILKSSLELIKNKSNPELIKATEKIFERRKTQAVNS